MALIFLNLGARRVEVVGGQHQAWQLYPRERPGNHYTGGWVGPRAGLDVYEKSCPTGIRSQDRPACSQSLYQLSYPGPQSVHMSVRLCLFYRIAQFD
jgi:hypothetical protein